MATPLVFLALQIQPKRTGESVNTRKNNSEHLNMLDSDDLEPQLPAKPKAAAKPTDQREKGGPPAKPAASYERTARFDYRSMG